jgi:chromosomal replication initiation ATPase DnaA
MVFAREVEEGAEHRLAAVDMAACACFGVAGMLLHGPRRGPRRVAAARQLAIYLARVTLGVPTRLVAAHAGRDRSTIAHACRVVEARRDDPCVDAAITALERGLARLMADGGGEPAE